MTPADRILKAAHMAIEAERALIDSARMTHQVVIRLKPRGQAIRASVTVEAVERDV